MNYAFKLVFCMTIFVTAAHAMEEQEYSIARRKYSQQDLGVMREKNKRYHARRRAQQQKALASGANKENHGDSYNAQNDADMGNITARLGTCNLAGHSITVPAQQPKADDSDDLSEDGVNIDLVNSAILAARTKSKK